MEVYSDKEQIEGILTSFKTKQLAIGFVPTMGALHQGHLALVKKALAQNDKVVVSIFVNPTQFNNLEDLKKYPRTLDEDLLLLKTVSDGIIVYTPTVEAMYEDNIKSEKFDFDGLEFEMEGRFRDGHFDGVGTIIKRLFNIIKPDTAYFGEKDFQQLQIIKKLAEKHKMPVSIIACPIYRETSGLAMSSRNTRLKPDYKKATPFIYKTLKTAKELFGTKSAGTVTEWVENQFSKHPLLKLEYFIIADEATLKTVIQKSPDSYRHKKTYRAFIAVYADEIRLIDNLALN